MEGVCGMHDSDYDTPIVVSLMEHSDVLMPTIFWENKYAFLVHASSYELSKNLQLFSLRFQFFYFLQIFSFYFLKME
jgi:hypothetical protein